MEFAIKEDKKEIMDLYRNVIEKVNASAIRLGWNIDTYPDEKFVEKAIMNGEACVLRDAGRIVAVAVVNHVVNPEYDDINWEVKGPRERIATIHALAVAPDLQGSKTSYRLLADIEEYCARNGDLAIHLDVIDTNIPAYKLYMRNGYREIDCIKMYYEVVGVREFWMMERVLKQKRVIESCAECLYDKQAHLTDDRSYLEEVRRILDERGEDDCAPYLVWRFNRIYEERFGKKASYREIKKTYNDLVLSMEASLRARIESSPDPLQTSFLFARIGNYIDFGAMNHVDEEVFLKLFENVQLRQQDEAVLESFFKQCEKASKFLLIADNCGEIVLDRLFLEQLRKFFPGMEFTVMVRGGEALNDATVEDAMYVGMDKIARIVTNGVPMTGAVYELLPEDSKKAMDEADLILAKGQGNYEALSRQGRHIFYSFLCKCDLFVNRFGVPRLTGVFVEER